MNSRQGRSVWILPAQNQVAPVRRYLLEKTSAAGAGPPEITAEHPCESPFPGQSTLLRCWHSWPEPAGACLHTALIFGGGPSSQVQSHQVAVLFPDDGGDAAEDPCVLPCAPGQGNPRSRAIRRPSGYPPLSFRRPSDSLRFRAAYWASRTGVDSLTGVFFRSGAGFLGPLCSSARTDFPVCVSSSSRKRLAVMTKQVSPRLAPQTGQVSTFTRFRVRATGTIPPEPDEFFEDL